MTNCNDTIRFPATLAGGSLPQDQSAGDANATRTGFVSTAIRRLLVALVSVQRKHRDKNNLRHLDDRLLKDVGLVRSDVEPYVSAPVMKDLPPRGY
ncbi:DUF1127 domain-containing protein [uncultured Thalassospira sp.]|jgi:uncharacterized protein YjiS (DUF1127 family)|uniref:DUF1127 domain-containing protein n=1 Tax=uncultured Thalassospira sp. TaxID=404382 RepID=UPI0030D8CCC4|tara:strand:+ start:6247 stop:6534 length:288 start_codon:yes stop_codon:yes gene_type:complete